MAVATFDNGQRPYSGPDRRSRRQPHAGSSPPGAGRNLSGKVAPRNASIVFNAETREEAPLTLLPTGAKTGLAFRLPDGGGRRDRPVGPPRGGDGGVRLLRPGRRGHPQGLCRGRRLRRRTRLPALRRSDRGARR
ncbi:hypothetical protein ACRAWD_02910 [Caulobacter segnis]